MRKKPFWNKVKIKMGRTNFDIIEISSCVIIKIAKYNNRYYYVTINIDGTNYEKQVERYEYSYAENHMGHEVPVRLKRGTIKFLGKTEAYSDIEFIELDDVSFWQKWLS